MVMLLIVANLGRIPVLSTGDHEAPLLVNDLCVACILAAGAIAIMRGRSLRLDRAATAAIAFAAVGGISAALAIPRFGLAPGEVLVSVAYLVRWLMYFGIYVVAINGLAARDVRPVWHAVETMLLVFAAFGVLQSAFLPGFAQLVYPTSRLFDDWDPQGHRLVSTVLEPNIAGAMLLIGLITQLSLLAAGARVARWKPLLLFTALVLTLSRSAVLGL